LYVVKYIRFHVKSNLSKHETDDFILIFHPFSFVFCVILFLFHIVFKFNILHCFLNGNQQKLSIFKIFDKN